MPSPALLEWCTQSMNSVQQTVQQILYSYAKADASVLPYIMEIQTLAGQSPGDKWKSLNAIVNTIVDDVKNGGDLQSHLSKISPVLLDLVKVNVGLKLQISQFIVESLKSEDATISKKALTANWFFDGGNPNVSVDYFANDILPFVSVRTRLSIVKKLAHGLRRHQDKARDVFFKFVDLYGVEENLPILTACTEDVIFNAILRFKIVLPLRILNVLYSKYRDLVVNYLQLANKNHIDNVNHRKVHEIHIHDYDTFLPKLIPHYPKDFLSLYQLTPEKNLEKLSVHRSTLLLSKVKNEIVGRSDIFFKLLQPKVLKSKLTEEEIETALENYLPKDISDFLLDLALKFLEDYSSTDKIQVLIAKFQKLYGKNLLDHVRKLIGTDSRNTSSVLQLLSALPSAERETLIKVLLDDVDDGSALKNVLTSYLGPREAFPYLKNKISKCPNADERVELIGLMISCCRVEKSKTDLLSVLQYYKERHKNEQHFVFCRFFEQLRGAFDLEALDEAHWSILRELIDNAYVKEELFTSYIGLIESVLEANLRQAISRKRKDERRVEKAIEMIVECKLTSCAPRWNVLEDNPALEKECLERFFLLIPLKFPEHHSFWKNQNHRLAVALALLKSIKSYNSRCAPRKSSKRNDLQGKSSKSINLKDYPWMLKLSEEFCSRSISGARKEALMRLLKQQAPDFYEAKMDESSPVRDISNGEALQLLKRQPSKVLAHWLDYLNEARTILESTDGKTREKLQVRRFVAATKWHEQIPLRFVESCLQEIASVGGSFALLGILLPGQAFEKLVAPYVPKEPRINASGKNAQQSLQMTRSILQGMRYSNPPVSLQSLQPLCRGDYLSFADATLASLTRRVRADGALEFAKRLASQPQVALMKRGIQLAKCVATQQQLQQLLIESRARSSEPSISKLHAKIIFEAFAKRPHADSWQLVRSFLRALSPDEKDVMENLIEIEKIDTEFLSDYVEEYLSKVEQLFAASLDFKWRTKSVCLLVESFDEKLINNLSEELSLKLLDKYFYDCHCSQISRATRFMAVRYYLLASSDNDKLEARLEAILGILSKTMDHLDAPHPKKRRFYPANYTVHEFFGDLLSELSSSCASNNTKLQIIQSVLDVFNEKLSPWQEPSSYLALNLFKEYLLSSSPEDFGCRTAKRIASLVEDFSSNEPIGDVADCLQDFIFHKIFRTHKDPFSLKLSLIEGLLLGEQHYGALASTKLLRANEVKEYDERYDRLIDSLRHVKNSAIQYNLYQHLNSLTEENASFLALSGGSFS